MNCHKLECYWYVLTYFHFAFKGVLFTSSDVFLLLGSKIVFDKSPIGHVNEYSTTHYFWNPRHTQSMIAYDFDRVFLEIPVKNCIMGMLLTCPIVFNISRPRRNGYCYVFIVQRHQYCIPADIACSRTCNSGYQQQFPDQTSPWWLYIWPSQLECCVHMARLPIFDLQVGK